MKEESVRETERSEGRDRVVKGGVEDIVKGETGSQRECRERQKGVKGQTE